MKTAIFDIDGTISDPSKRVHHVLQTPKNWDEFFKKQIDDDPIKPMFDVAHALSLSGVKIVMCTGRDSKYMEDTINWMDKHKFPYNKLYMRPLGDKRDDVIIKEELYQKILNHGYNPFIVFEDRNRVVDFWRSTGLICCQVQPGDF